MNSRKSSAADLPGSVEDRQLRFHTKMHNDGWASKGCAATCAACACETVVITTVLSQRFYLELEQSFFSVFFCYVSVVFNPFANSVRNRTTKYFFFVPTKISSFAKKFNWKDQVLVPALNTCSQICNITGTC